MTDTRIVVKTAIASVMAIGLIGATTHSVAAKAGHEKCAGIVKKGQNDCGNSSHKCSGQAARDGVANEWLYVPIGTCQKIVGGTLFKKNKS
ncbi:MAG: DUF2282 domain-containing protein [Gammaproteobacteria bacterium]|nr:DUF2282 domain-containing protein [Gammaproteobacteria bacterium]